MITSIQALTEEKCVELYSVVCRLKEFWIPRGQPPTFFFTLGTASYLDITSSTRTNAAYYEKSQQYNQILMRHFGWLYECISTVLAHHLGATTSYKENCALPGFHIFLPPAICTKPTASIHFDLQYQSLNWQDSDNPDFTRLISFTLPISLPKSGGGLNIWDVAYEEFLKAHQRGLGVRAEEIQRLKTKMFCPYTIGNLVLHSGLWLHQIAPVAGVLATDRRITLQGHGVWCGNQWKLYW